MPEILMVHTDRDALERRRLLLPARDRRLPALEKRSAARTVAFGVRRIELRHALHERRRDPGDVARVGMDVRIAAGMHVPERPVDHLRDLQPGDVLRGLEVTRAAELD